MCDSRAGRSRRDAVILACPAYVAAELLRTIDAQAAARCAEVPYASSASVTLAWPRSAVAHPLRGSGFVVARRYNNVRITACTWVSSKWAGRAPADAVLLRAFIGGSHDPGAVDLTDDEMIARVVRDLSPLLGITGSPQMSQYREVASCRRPAPGRTRAIVSWPSTAHWRRTADCSPRGADFDRSAFLTALPMAAPLRYAQRSGLRFGAEAFKRFYGVLQDYRVLGFYKVR